MTEDPLIIRTNIAYLEALLHLNMSAQRRSVIRRLLIEAHTNLKAVTAEARMTEFARQ